MYERTYGKCSCLTQQSRHIAKRTPEMEEERTKRRLLVFSLVTVCVCCDRTIVKTLVIVM